MADITIDELKSRLAESDDLLIVDVRDASAYKDWHIPGAISVPVIQALRDNDWGPMQDAASKLPKDKPLVVVCNMGISSRKAMNVLAPMGFEVDSLEGGMHGWSQVASEANVPFFGRDDVTVIQVRRNSKGCLSYFLGCGKEAIVIDPSAEVEVYESIAKRNSMRVVKVLETHVHADHLSRARELAEATGAALVLPENNRVKFSYEKVRGGDSIEVGNMTITVLGTPGHTGESSCYLVEGKLLFTGDTLFTDSVGRPDLEKGDAGAEAGAHALYQSLHERLLRLPDDVLVLPAHTGPGIPFDGKPIMANLGEVKKASKLLLMDEAKFVPEIVSRIGEKPPSFTSIIAVNEGKADMPADPSDLEVGPNRCAVG